MLNKLSDEEQYQAYLEEHKNMSLSELHRISTEIGLKAVDDYPLTFVDVLKRNKRLKAIKELIKQKREQNGTI